MYAKSLLSYEPYIHQLTSEWTHIPLIAPPEIKGILKRKEAESYSLSCTFQDSVQTIKNSGLDIECYVALRVHWAIWNRRTAGQICARPIANVTSYFPALGVAVGGLFIQLEDIRRKEKKGKKDAIRVYDTICIVGEKQMILYKNNFVVVKKIINTGYLFRLLNNYNCGQLIGNKETEKTKWISLHRRKSTVSIRWLGNKNNQTDKKLSYGFIVNAANQFSKVVDQSEKSKGKSVHKKPPRQPHKIFNLIAAPAIMKQVGTLANDTYSLSITFEEDQAHVGMKSARSIAFRVNEIISKFKVLGLICNRPIAQVKANFRDSAFICHGVWIKLEDKRQKGLVMHDTICIVGERQMILFNIKDRAKNIKNDEYFVRLLEGKGCGQLIGDRETQKMKKRDGLIQPTISIAKSQNVPQEVGKKLSYDFFVDEENHISGNNDEEKKAEKDPDFDI